jgi:hypothetical protein
VSSLSRVQARIEALSARIRANKPSAPPESSFSSEEKARIDAEPEAIERLRDSAVYLIGLGCLVKIGVSRFPEERVRSVGVSRGLYARALRNGAISDKPFRCRDAPELLGIVPGDRREEGRLHKLFAPWQARRGSGFYVAPGEWFEWCPGLRELEKVAFIVLARYRSGGNWRRLAVSLDYQTGIWTPDSRK